MSEEFLYYIYISICSYIEKCSHYIKIFILFLGIFKMIIFIQNVLQIIHSVFNLYFVLCYLL